MDTNSFYLASLPSFTLPLHTLSPPTGAGGGSVQVMPGRWLISTWKQNLFQIEIAPYFAHILVKDWDISSAHQSNIQRWSSPCSCPLQSTYPVMHMYMLHFVQTRRVWCHQNHSSDSCPQVRVDRHIGSIRIHQSAVQGCYFSWQ